MIDCTFIILGATGDLAKRKLLPALCAFIHKNQPKNYRIIGAAFDDISVDTLFEHGRSYIPPDLHTTYNELKQQTDYQKLDFLNPQDFIALRELVESREHTYGLSGNRLVYLAAATHFYCPITEHLAQSKLVVNASELNQRWHRVVYEKPFGHDRASAEVINACISRYFSEEQIYRIDHYLTKELVSNIALLRFTNCVFEPLWNKRYIDNVQIILNEEIGIENRGSYYDAYGALSDVVQNHMLQLMALVAMESPKFLTGEYIRTARRDVLQHVEIVDGLLGQYQGYRQEEMVAPDSRTETFAALHLKINNERWSGVPFYLKTGKWLEKKETVIYINFKEVTCLLTNHCPSPSNYLTIRIAPEAVFSLSLNAKKTGVADEVMPINMDFCHSCIFGLVTPEAYEVIFQEIIKGEQSIAVRFDEIEAAWDIIDKLKAHTLPVYPYPMKGSGPKEVKDFEKKHGMRWRS